MRKLLKLSPTLWEHLELPYMHIIDLSQQTHMAKEEYALSGQLVKGTVCNI